MVRIRLQRIGKRNKPTYRIVVIPSQLKRSSKTLDIIGAYDPKLKVISINQEKYNYWKNRGAQPSERVAKLINKPANYEIHEIK